MTLADLLTTLATRGALKASRVKDIRTATRSLAAALGHGAPEQCPLDETCLEEATWLGKLDDHFATRTAVSAYTRRNTKNNLRVLMRTAEAHGLLAAPLSPRLLTAPQRTGWRHQQRETAPYKTTYYLQTGPRRFGLPEADWPPDIQAGWRDYQAACGLRLRATTFLAYKRALATYLGYLAHERGRTPTWEDCFDTGALLAFVTWHAQRLQCTISAHARNVVMQIAAMAKVIKHEHAKELAALRNTLHQPPPMHNKRQHWVSLRQLGAVAETCLAEGRAPVPARSDTRSPGLRRATQFQKGLMLMLLTRIPLRQRNLRELRFERNLYQDHGHWHMHFRGDELKIGRRGGVVNEYHVDLTGYCAQIEREPVFIPVLEEWIKVYRPRLPNASTSPFLFLTRNGRPFTAHALGTELSEVVAMYTGQRFYPHLIRTIWASAYIETTGDFTGAATMLGDTVQTVMKAYHSIVEKDQHKKAAAFLATALHTG